VVGVQYENKKKNDAKNEQNRYDSGGVNVRGSKNIRPI
jgi:hypothetical protein